MIEELEKTKKKVADIDRSTLKVKLSEKTIGEVLRFYVDSNKFTKVRGFTLDNAIKSISGAKRLMFETTKAQPA